MLRKTILAIAASVALGAAALAPIPHPPIGAAVGTAAGMAAGCWHGPVIRVYAGPGYGGCMVRRWVYTPYGPVLRWVNRCY